ncbi:MAG TPA: NAD-binding protein [Acidimicrobiales bacterium]|nr:NAD-binding protein [Acidimicrobiales bacterium]
MTDPSTTDRPPAHPHLAPTSPSRPAGRPTAAVGGHVIVCGLAGVGLRTVEQLRLSDVGVVVVDDDPDPRLGRVVQGWGVPLVPQSPQMGDWPSAAGLDRARAVVCALPDELAALETALRVRELRPDIRLVVQMANPAVAQALERVTGPGTVLDVATLSAPSFVEACLRRSTHHLDLGGRRFSVDRFAVGDGRPPSTLRNLFGQLAPVAVLPADGSDLVVCPGRDHPVVAGDRVAVLGTPDELDQLAVDRLGLRRPSADRPAVAAVGPAARVHRRVRALLQTSSSRALAAVLLGLVLLLVAAAVVLRLAYQYPAGSGGRLPLLSSAYFTVETVATVGFGDFSFAHQPAWLQVFGIALIVLGVSLVSTAFALFTNILVSRRLEQSLGRRQVPGMAGHVVVVGLGSVGISVVEGLVAEGRRVVVVDRDVDNRYLGRVRALGVPVVVADATQRQTHAMVNLDQCIAVAVTTSADFTNIETGLAVRESLGDRREDVPVVLRIFDGHLARMMERNFGFGYVRSTSALAAPWFAGAALGLDVLATFYVDQQPFLVGAVSVTGGLQGVAMGDLSARTRVVAISRAAAGGQLEHPPRRGTRFAGGDRAYLLGPYEELLSVLRRDQLAG